MAIIEPWPWLPRVGDLRHTAAAVVDYFSMGTEVGHSDICSGPVGDPEKCPVCKTRPPLAQDDAAEIARLRGLLEDIVDESNHVVGRGKRDPRLARICEIAAQGI